MIDEVDPQVIYERDGGTCYLCGQLADRGQSGALDATLDHIVPITKGGEHSYANVRLAHRFCNSLKGDQPIDLEKLPSPEYAAAVARQRRRAARS